MAKMLKNKNFSENKRKYNSENELNEDKQKNKYSSDDDDSDDDDSDDDDSDDDSDDDDSDDDDSDDDDDDEDDDDTDNDADDQDSNIKDEDLERKPLVLKDLISFEVIPKGEYDAMIYDLTVENSVGKYGKFNFLIVHLAVLVGGEEVEITDRMTFTISEKSKLGKMLMALLGKIPKLDYDLTKLINREIGVKISHRKDEQGRIWADVEYLG